MRLWRVVSWALMVFAFVLSVYRAATQPIGHDEALNYNWFLDQGVYHLLNYNMANHVLFSLLAKPLLKIFGVTELTLRTPALIGFAGYLLAIYLLCLTLFGDTLWLAVSVAMLCLNPQVLEFASAARGYMLGLACLAACMYVMARAVEWGAFSEADRRWRWACAAASVLLAFSVAANLTNVIPAMALVLCFALIVCRAVREFRSREGRAAVQGLSRYLVLPGFLVGVTILWPFLIQVRPGSFVVPGIAASEMLRDIFNGSFLYKWTDDMLCLGSVAAAPGSWQARMSDMGIYLLLPAVVFFVGAGVYLSSRAGSETRRTEAAWCRLFGGAALLSVALIVALHFAAKMAYPYTRYCLYLVPLFTIGVLLAGREMCARFDGFALRAAGLVVCFLLIFDYAASLNTKYLRYQSFDAVSRDLFFAIEKDAKSRGLKNAKVGGTWWYEPEFNFYRVRYHSEWAGPYDVKDRSYFWETPNGLKPGDYDYFVFVPASDPGLPASRTVTIFQDHKTHLTAVAILQRSGACLSLRKSSLCGLVANPPAMEADFRR